MDLTVIFEGVETAVSSKSFSGGTITAIFGRVDLDLRNAGISEFPAEINGVVMFGGADIKVPKEWDVKLDALSLLGGAGDERGRSKTRIENKKDNLI
ncbi:MAG: hypothetical protein ACOC6H_02765 [Thermoproteota archaeon]